MTTSDGVADGDATIRETYEVYDDGERNVARITDPENPDAWIQSDRVRPIVQ